MMYLLRSWAYLLRKSFDANFSDDINDLTTSSDKISVQIALFFNAHLQAAVGSDILQKGRAE